MVGPEEQPGVVLGWIPRHDLVYLGKCGETAPRTSTKGNPRIRQRKHLTINEKHSARAA
jgi:hypothetical protein